MDASLRTPLVECFVAGAVPREVRLAAARGTVAVRAHEQLTLLMLLRDDPDPEVAATALQTADLLAKPALAGFLARDDVPADLRHAFGPLVAGEVGVKAAADTALIVPGAAIDDVDPSNVVIDDDATPVAGPKRVMLSALSVVQRIKVAMTGTREQRAVLIRDPNRLVSAAVLGSPKLTETEVEGFARAGNVAEETLRVIGTNRNWLKNYLVVAALVKNAKTPLAISLPLMTRLNERDLKSVSTDRNVPEGIRLTARKIITASQSRKQ